MFSEEGLMKLIVKTEGELLKYLEENLDMPKKRIKQYLTHGSIYVNNNRTTKYNYKLVPGMNITIDTDSKNKKTLPFEVLFEESGAFLFLDLALTLASTEFESVVRSR